MLSGYFNGIPRELDDAAKVDGCTPLGALFRVILPAARPGVVAVAIYSFMTAWGEVLFASVMTTDANRTLAVGLRLYSTRRRCTGIRSWPRHWPYPCPSSSSSSCSSAVSWPG